MSMKPSDVLIGMLVAGLGAGFMMAQGTTVTMMAALPCAVNPFLLASRYEAYTRRASAAIVLSTAASLVTVTIAMALAR